MANKREIKKDIDYLIFEVVSDCYTFKYLFPDKDQKDIDNIIEEAVIARNELIMRVNHPDGKNDKKLVKEHFKKINVDLLTKVDNYFDRLNKMMGDSQKKAAPKTEKPKDTKPKAEKPKVEEKEAKKE